jgi:hypothetical protein
MIGLGFGCLLYAWMVRRSELEWLPVSAGILGIGVLWMAVN